MTPEEFDSALRRWMQSEKFVPFVVERSDATELLISDPNVIFEDGIASYLDPETGGLVDFSHDEVTGFRAAAMEAQR